ncbi:uncharacterized protein B0H18DRAFT_954275 [Fomitopsis serialis]|uniref:uncharacterized protein n=1 Tax=Fomitopsis serialis TaxID=139415 RepID=UPI002008867B|nr:uncharacterized protein B0H18DRAFT_954275 [Neoantrodia serialis]KAH9927848.1 hypothetical protein B0H18DRAFT_954275 [Neoantrodia serialis]
MARKLLILYMLDRGNWGMIARSSYLLVSILRSCVCGGLMINLKQTIELVFQVYTRAGRVRVIFSLPEKILRQWFPPGTAPQCPRHLVYVEWFSKFAAAPDSHHHMYKIKALTGPERIASVVPLAMLERSVHLHLKWGGPVPVHWTSENVLDNLPQYYSFAHYSETTVCELVNAIKYGLITELPGIITNNRGARAEPEDAVRDERRVDECLAERGLSELGDLALEVNRRLLARLSVLGCGTASDMRAIL